MVKEKRLLEDLINLIDSKREIFVDDKSPIDVYSQYKHRLGDLSKFKILLLNAPCNGFGDVVFGMKLRNYLKEWYNADVKIASTKVDNFKTLGEKDENLISLKGGKSDQCRRFRHLNFVDKSGNIIPAPQADLILIAPVQMDFSPDYSDVKILLPYSTYFNTYFFSEYNDDLQKGFDFNTGVGDDRMGLLFTKNKKTQRLTTLKNPYVVVYIAQTVNRADTCFIEFVEMVAKKYNKLKKFDIVVPPWIGQELEENIGNIQSRFLGKTKKFFDEINIVKKDMMVNVYQNPDGVKNILTIRADVLPLPYDSMRNLFTYALKEILLTGDQSITDVLSCCWKNKLPFYQIVPWKKDFSKELSKHLPQKFLKYITTSCGSLKAIKYNPNFEKFIKKWDFRKLAKPKLDGIIAFLNDVKSNEIVKNIQQIFFKSRSKETLISKLENLM